MRALALAAPALFLLAVPLSANGPAAGGDPALLAADRELARATTARGLDGYLGGFAPDATLSRFGAPDLTGESAIRAYLSPLFAAPGLAFSWQPEEAHVAASGDLGWTWGRYRLAAAPAVAGEPPRQEEGYYVRVWRRPQVDGPWKVAADVINTRSALPTGARPAAPQSEPIPTTSFTAGDRAAVMLADSDFDQAAAARGAEGWVSWFTPDGIQIGSGDTLLRGHAAIRAQMEPILADPATDLRWRPLTAEAAAAGDLAYTIGAFEFVEKGKDGAAPKVLARGRYLTVWAKQADGGWKVVADIGNPYL